jgi:hypothetical protein
MTVINSVQRIIKRVTLFIRAVVLPQQAFLL